MVRLLRLRVHRAVLRKRVLPGRERHGAADEGVGRLCARLLRAAARVVDLRPPRRSHGPAALDGHSCAHDVVRVAHGRDAADLCDDRRHGAGAAHRRPYRPGHLGRRRIRYERGVHERSGARGAPRVLCLLPVRHLDRRPAARDSGVERAAAGARRGRDASVGLAHPLRDRSDRCAGRPVSAHVARGNVDSGVPRSPRRGHTARAARAPPRGDDHAGVHRGGLAALLHVHDVHAEVPREHRRFPGRRRHEHHDGGAELFHAGATRSPTESGGGRA